MNGMSSLRSSTRSTACFTAHSTVLALATLAAPALAQDATAKHLTVSGAATANWVSSMGATPIAAGEYSLHRKGGHYHLRVVLPGLGQIEFGRDDEGAWCIDPEAGPMLRSDLAAAADARLIALLADDVVTARTGYEPGATGTDKWTTDPDGNTTKVELAAETAMGEPAQWVVTFGTRALDAPAAAPRSVQWQDRFRRVDFSPAAHSSDPQTVDTARFTMRPELREAATKFAAAKAGSDDGIPATTCRIMEWKGQLVARMRAPVDAQEISKELGRMLPALMRHIMGHGGATAGAPYTRYHSFDGKTFDLECGIPIVAKLPGTEEIEVATLPSGPAATTWHIGPYDKLPTAHTRLEKWITDAQHTKDGGAMEVYWTDPGLERDPRKWRTQVVQFLRDK